MLSLKKSKDISQIVDDIQKSNQINVLSSTEEEDPHYQLASSADEDDQNEVKKIV